MAEATTGNAELKRSAGRGRASAGGVSGARGRGPAAGGVLWVSARLYWRCLRAPASPLAPPSPPSPSLAPLVRRRRSLVSEIAQALCRGAALTTPFPVETWGRACFSPDRTERAEGLCHKISFETICGMLFLHGPRCIMRESNDGDQFQRCPFPQRGYSHGSPLVCIPCTG